MKKLPVVSQAGNLLGMYVWGDLKKDQSKREKFSLDEEGHFLVGAAIGVGKEDAERADLLVSHGCRVLVVDSSHGACKPVKDMLRSLREKHGDKVDIIAGNIASYDSAMYLLADEASRPDALKVGIGPGMYPPLFVQYPSPILAIQVPYAPPEALQVMVCHR